MSEQNGRPAPVTADELSEIERVYAVTPWPPRSVQLDVRRLAHALRKAWELNEELQEQLGIDLPELPE